MYMLKTEPALYKVVGRENNHLWLEVLEGDEQGIRVSVPVSDPESESKDIQSRDLSVGEERKLILESTDERPPDWRLHEICDDGDWATA